MKTYKKILILLTLLAMVNISYGTNNILENINVSKTINGQDYSFLAQLEKSQVSSTLKVTDKTGKVLYTTKFNYNLDDKNYKITIVDQVLNAAKDLRYPLNVSAYQQLSDDLTTFLDLIYADLKKQTQTESFKSLWYHYSIINVKKRSLQNNTEVCVCTIHPAFLIGKTGFICQEDQFWDRMQIINIIKKAPSEFKDENSTRLLAFLEKDNSKLLNFTTVYNFYFPSADFLASIKSGESNRCYLGSGSGHGCCGNYGGCCYYVNPLCYLHDSLCTSCKPRWLCLPGCVRD